jgi:hypothetical protein
MRARHDKSEQSVREIRRRLIFEQPIGFRAAGRAPQKGRLKVGMRAGRELSHLVQFKTHLSMLRIVHVTLAAPLWGASDGAEAIRPSESKTPLNLSNDSTRRATSFTILLAYDASLICAIPPHGDSMPAAKQLLLKQTAEAFSGRSDMPLMASLADITQAEASWCPGKDSPSSEQIVRHVAWAKARYCQQAFKTDMPIVDDSVNGDGDSADLPWEFPCGAAWGLSVAQGIHQAIKLLETSHAILTKCLESLPDHALDQPIPTRHGKSAAHFFWIMIMHDLYHAGQIRTRRTAWRARLINAS